jgi:pimeloyl-ACP methyl ester carboxylesterase
VIASSRAKRAYTLVPCARAPYAVSYPGMAADVVGALDRAGIERAAVVGHSMGGKTAMQLALTHPERVSCARGTPSPPWR